MAFKANALIIPACGFDSIPPDIAVFVSNRYVKAVLGPTTSIEDSVTLYDVQGGFSGGSTDSIISFVEDVPRDTLIESAADYVLCHRESRDRLILQRLTFPPRSPWTSQSPHEIRVQAPIWPFLVVARNILATTDGQPANGSPLLVIIPT